MEKRLVVRKLTRYAMIAAIYAVTSLALSPISFGFVQFRISEALTLLPLVMPEAVIGVTLGCAITNAIGAMTGANILGVLDIFVGTLATLIAALLTLKVKHIRIKNIPILAAVPPIVVNAVFIGAELAFAFSEGSMFPLFWTMALSVGVGQFVSCVLLGIPFIMQLEKLNWKN